MQTKRDIQAVPLLLGRPTSPKMTFHTNYSTLILQAINHSFFYSFSSSLLSQAGYLVSTECQSMNCSDRSTMTFTTSVEGIRTCLSVFSSRKVTVLSLRVSQSMVMANGIPISSVRAYLFPIACPPSSTLQVIRFFFSSFPKLVSSITKFMGDFVELAVGLERKQRHLDRCNLGSQTEVGTLLISNAEAMFQDAVENTTQTK